MLTPLFLVALCAFQDPSAEIYDRLKDIERETPEVLVARAVTPAVVFIETEMVRSTIGRYGRRTRKQTYQGSGSGVVVRPEGYIITNFHVIKDAQEISVSFRDDERVYRAIRVASSPHEDLALLRITGILPRKGAGLGRQPDPSEVLIGLKEETLGPFPVARMGTSDDLMPGERVIAIGNPHGQTHTVSTGIISGLHRALPLPSQGLEFQDLIQTDASINFGNSGGPLLNIHGELIGINTAMNSQAENIGFAIPVDQVKRVLDNQLFPQAQMSWLGIEVSPDTTGLKVDYVWIDGPADKSGICAGDRIVGLSGVPVSDLTTYNEAGLSLLPGATVEVAYRRPGESPVLKARLASWDKIDGALYEHLGMTVEEVRMDGRTFLRLDRVRRGGPAHDINLQIGDWFPELNYRLGGTRYRSPLHFRRDLMDAIEASPPGTEVHIHIFRDDDGDRQIFEDEEHYEGVLTVR